MEGICGGPHDWHGTSKEENDGKRHLQMGLLPQETKTNRYKDRGLPLETESLQLEGRLTFFCVVPGVLCILKIMCMNYFFI